MKPNEKQLEILRHALGHGHSSPLGWRNNYAVDPGSADHAEILRLVDAGLMSVGKEIPGGLRYYHATPAGKKAVIVAEPKRSPGQQRYREYLESDCGMSFREWLQSRSYRTRERYGEYISLVWEGDPPYLVLRDHVDQMTAKQIFAREEPHYQSAAPRHAYARWSCEPGEDGCRQTLRIYDTPGRGCFKVTVADVHTHVCAFRNEH